MNESKADAVARIREEMASRGYNLDDFTDEQIEHVLTVVESAWKVVKSTFQKVQESINNNPEMWEEILQSHTR